MRMRMTRPGIAIADTTITDIGMTVMRITMMTMQWETTPTIGPASIVSTSTLTSVVQAC
jgi:hypothetical protein